MPSVLTRYQEIYPKVSFNIYQGHTLRLLDELKKEPMMWLFVPKTEDTELEFIPILAQRLILVVRADHPLPREGIGDAGGN